MDKTKRAKVEAIEKKISQSIAAITAARMNIKYDLTKLTKEIDVFNSNENSDHTEAVRLLQKSSELIDSFRELDKSYRDLLELHDDWVQSEVDLLDGD